MQANPFELLARADKRFERQPHSLCKLRRSKRNSFGESKAAFIDRGGSSPIRRSADAREASTSKPADLRPSKGHDPGIAVARAETIGFLELVMDGELRVDGLRARRGRDDHANRVFALPAEPKEFAVIGNTACLRMQ